MPLSLIAKHSGLNRTPDPIGLEIGEVVPNFFNKRLYTKSLASRLLTVGNSLRKLTQFKEFIFDRISTNTNLAFLRVTVTKESNLRLTTTLPFLSLTNLTNVNITSNVAIKPYLGYSTDVYVTNILPPSLNLNNLTEVNFPTLTSTFNNYAVTSVAGEYSPNKDVFAVRKGNYSYRWILAPESTKVVTLTDVQGTPNPYSVLRRRRNVEQPNNAAVFIEPLHIAGDSHPELSANLDVVNYSIFNQLYMTKTFNLTNNTETVSLNLAGDNVFVLNCNDSVYNLTLDVIPPTVEGDSQSFLAIFAVTLNNFKGSISFPVNTRFENGQASSLQGDTHIFTGSYVSNWYGEGAGTPLIKIYQKSTNLSRSELAAKLAELN